MSVYVSTIVYFSPHTVKILYYSSLSLIMTHTRLFESLIMSTVWQAPDRTRILWITMLALRDRRHRVVASIPGLAGAARIPLEDCLSGLELLSAPDPYSGPEHEGRKIEAIDGGWLILDGEKYRQEESRESQRIKQLEYQAQRRASRVKAPKSKTNGRQGTRLAMESLPDEWREWAVQHKVANPQEAFAEFRDHWISVPGHRGSKRDWFATFRNAIRHGFDGSRMIRQKPVQYIDG